MAEYWDVLNADRNKTGRVHMRGTPMKAGDYHVVVHVWIWNKKGEFLISKRSPGIDLAGFWQTTGGSAVTGDTSLGAALRETQEELGVILDPFAGERFYTTRLEHDNDPGGWFLDAWLFRAEVDLKEVVLQEGETCDAMWASRETILEMCAAGTFFDNEKWSYMDELFAHCAKEA